MSKKLRISVLTAISFFVFNGFALGTPQSEISQNALDVTKEDIGEFKELDLPEHKEEAPKEAAKEAQAPAPIESAQMFTLDFKDADIKNVLRVIAIKGGVNIVSTKDVEGTITIRLANVTLDQALDTILKTFDFGYEKFGDIVIVTSLDKLHERRKKEQELAGIEPVVSKVVVLKYIDAEDARKSLEPILSLQGKITILEATGQKGWEFGAEKTGKRSRTGTEGKSRTKTLIVADVPSRLEIIEEIIKQLDVMPQQILIEARIVEVRKDWLKDLGIDFGTGTTGAESSTAFSVPFNKHPQGTVSSISGKVLSSQKGPSSFGSKTGANSIYPFNEGLSMVFKKLRGTQFELILHALEEDDKSNILSAPRIITLNNQEAAILVGEKYPILKSDVATETGTSLGKTLDYYQDIGIQLNVVPQISADKYINLIIHPAVTEIGGFVGTDYPRITTREAETQILMYDGETIVIGGLLKNIKGRTKISVPLLGDLPFIGALFQRYTEDTEKIDLLIFITAHIIKPMEMIEKRTDTIALKEMPLGLEQGIIPQDLKEKFKKSQQ